MRKTIKVILLTILSFTNGTVLRAQTEDYENYDQVQEAVNRLEQENKYEEALKLMKSVKGKFPGYEYEIIREFAYLYMKTEQYEKCLEIWRLGHEKGFFFLIHPSLPLYKPLKDLGGFDALAEEDNRLRQIALESSKTIYELKLPSGYDKNKKYPLLLVLHGGGSTIARARKHWLSPVMDRDYIVVFVQSYLHYGLKDFGWRKEDPRAREDIGNIYREIISQYPVDTTRIIIGGISAGGSSAMDFSLNRIIPTRGFIGICPAVSGDRFSVEVLENARQAGIQAYIITGENDYNLEEQEKVVELFKSAKLVNKFTVIPGMGHEYPDDFSKLLDSALSYFNDIG